MNSRSRTLYILTSKTVNENSQSSNIKEQPVLATIGVLYVGMMVSQSPMSLHSLKDFFFESTITMSGLKGTISILGGNGPSACV